MNERNEYLHESFRRVGALFRRQRGERNAPNTQNRALSVLAMNDGISQKQLSYILGIRPQSSGEIVMKMEKNGWIERKSDAEDSRINRLYLTDEGRKQAKLVDDSENREDVLDCLSAEEKEQLSFLLDKIVRNNPEGDSRDDMHFRMPSRFRRPHMEARRMPFEREDPERCERGHIRRRERTI
ncbi:MAG: MarR family transcriptional regulator [Erysipelotrichaceae bacterium]|jgi:DNA-binding MarR family transcriptional regulator|nr:MarR family transcriptional regulator [Erysipelotrichaceae bacterium]